MDRTDSHVHLAMRVGRLPWGWRSVHDRWDAPTEIERHVIPDEHWLRGSCGLHRVPPRPSALTVVPAGSPPSVAAGIAADERRRRRLPLPLRSARSDLAPSPLTRLRDRLPRGFVASRPSVDIPLQRPLQADSRRPSASGLPHPGLVPPSWFRTTSTGSSAETGAGLLHPAADPGVRRVSRRLRLSRERWLRRSPRRATPSKNLLVRRRGCVTAPSLPTGRCTERRRHRGDARELPPLTRGSDLHACARRPPLRAVHDRRDGRGGRVRSPQSSASRPFSADESETPHTSFEAATLCPSLGFAPLRGRPTSAADRPRLAPSTSGHPSPR
jgi:hypothetical protein